MSDVSNIENLELEDLRTVMFDRLHGKQSIGPPIDPRGDTRPHRWLVETFKTSTNGLRDRMDGVATEFTNELTDGGRWPVEARVNLLDLDQECGFAENSIRRLIQKRVFVGGDKRDPDAHAMLLKTSVGLGVKWNPGFWLEQLDLLGSDYGALVFSGLLEHGLDTAASRLDRCCASDEAVGQMAFIVPSLVDRYGADAVTRSFSPYLDRLPEALRTALEAEGLPLEIPAQTRRRVVREDGNVSRRTIAQHAYLVKNVLNRLVPEGHLAQDAPDFGDLYSAGVIGLVDAVDRFDPDGGGDFVASATHRIEGAIFERLLRRALPHAKARVRRFRLSPEDEADLFQDLSLHLVKNDFRVLRSWDPKRGSLESYIGMVTTWACLDSLRSSFHAYAKRKADLEPKEPATADPIELVQDNGPSPDERLHRMQVEETAFRCLEEWSQTGTLKEKDRFLLELRFRGVNFKEIGELIGISEHNANVRFSRLKENLRRRLQRAGITDLEIG